MATEYETYGEYLTRLMRQAGIASQKDLSEKLELFAQHRYGFQERFSTGSISQWKNNEAFPQDLKREIIGAYFGEPYPLTSVILTMRRLLRLASSHAA